MLMKLVKMQMTSIKIWLFGIITAILLIGGIYAGWMSHKLTLANSVLNQALSQANLDIGKAHTQLGDANKKIEELTTELQKVIKDHKETIISYNELWAKYQNQSGGHSEVITPTTPTVVVVSETFKSGLLYLAQSENTLQPLWPPPVFNYIDERLTINSKLISEPIDNKYVLYLDNNYTLTLFFKLNLVQTISPSGMINNYAELWEIMPNGKEIEKLEITKFESLVTDQRVAHLMWWAPHLDLGIIGGWNGAFIFGGSIGFSSSGFGLTRNDLTWRFLRVGITLGEKVGLDFTPILWNVNLPLISNLWIAPMITYNGRLGAGLFLGVVL